MKKNEFKSVLQNWDTATPEKKQEAGLYARMRERSAVTSLESAVTTAVVLKHVHKSEVSAEWLTDLDEHLEWLDLLKQLFPEQEEAFADLEQRLQDAYKTIQELQAA